MYHAKHTKRRSREIDKYSHEKQQSPGPSIPHLAAFTCSKGVQLDSLHHFVRPWTRFVGNNTVRVLRVQRGCSFDS